MAFAQSILIICENEERHDDSTSDVSDCDHNPSEIIKAALETVSDDEVKQQIIIPICNFIQSMTLEHQTDVFDCLGKFLNPVLYDATI